MQKQKKKAIISALGIFAVMGGTTALVLLSIISAWTYILAAIACYPMAKIVWAYAAMVRHEPIRIINPRKCHLQHRAPTLTLSKAKVKNNIQHYIFMKTRKKTPKPTIFPKNCLSLLC